MLINKYLRGLVIIFCLIGLLGNSLLVFAAETPADDTVVAEATPTPEPTPTIPPSFYEPIQTNEVSNWPQGPAVYAESAIVMDANTGTILYGKDIDAIKYPASITKIMTTLVAIENSNPNERVIFSDHAIWGIERDSSHIGIRIGENLSMKDCLYAMMLASANEVCLAVAEHVAGDVPTFVEMMNQKAAELGCTNTNFTNPNGLPDEEHYTSARDMALISKAAFENDMFRKVCATKAYKIGWTNKAGEDRWLGNHHKMLWDNSSYYYEGCLGGKTGFTRVALNTLVTYANRDERNLICVSLRTNGAQVYLDTAAMLDYGFHNFHNVAANNTKRTEYGTYLMPFPAALFNCYSAQTVADLNRPVTVSLPKEASANDLAVQTTSDISLITQTFSYNDYPVGEDIIHQPAGISSLASLPDSFVSTSTSQATPTPSASGISGVKNKVASTWASFEELPSWKYPLLALLALLLLIIIIKIGFAIKRSKAKKRRRKR